ncbi:hypothetical protein B0T16DRAFT_462938 [Cercophora newfieldiana]|uniref:EKC/KEOPS complex subunit GON7 n=1 Tax=Cercophora newfieldiana TaxID=92897 RepID=A0AA39XS58_9PEZI|nr:hypothetical protein B0T16DRAFT_462938 [Cercophora newfieldiana]
MAAQPNNNQTTSSPLTLSATYTSTSCNASFTITSPLEAPSTTLPPVTSKSDYLQRLRASVTTVQEQVNKELTARMEQDNLAASAPADSKDEENYGEEMQEDED